MDMDFPLRELEFLLWTGSEDRVHQLIAGIAEPVMWSIRDMFQYAIHHNGFTPYLNRIHGSRTCTCTPGCRHKVRPAVILETIADRCAKANAIPRRDFQLAGVRYLCEQQRPLSKLVSARVADFVFDASVPSGVPTRRHVIDRRNWTLTRMHTVLEPLKGASNACALIECYVMGSPLGPVPDPPTRQQMEAKHAAADYMALAHALRSAADAMATAAAHSLRQSSSNEAAAAGAAAHAVSPGDDAVSSATEAVTAAKEALTRVMRRSASAALDTEDLLAAAPALQVAASPMHRSERST
jgi:hypothetical protein